MENKTTINILGKENINLRFTLGRSIILRDMLHALDIRKNLISGSLLVQLSYKIVLESNKIVTSKDDIFIRKGFVFEGLFKLNIIYPSINKNYFSDPSQSILLNSKFWNVWHSRLGHANLKYIQKMFVDTDSRPDARGGWWGSTRGIYMQESPGRKQVWWGSSSKVVGNRRKRGEQSREGEKYHSIGNIPWGFLGNPFYRPEIGSFLEKKSP